MKYCNTANIKLYKMSKKIVQEVSWLLELQLHPAVSCYIMLHFNTVRYMRYDKV